MPRYAYRCTICGKVHDEIRPVDRRLDETSCMVCLGAARYDFNESVQPHTDTGYQRPILSESLGIHPDQIPEARRRFPHHEFAPDGRMILSSHQQRNRVLRDLGFYDKN